MRVILKTPPVPTTFTDPRSGLLHEGKASLQVIVYEPGEVARRGDGAERSVPTLADWRKNRDSSGAIVVHPGAAMAAVAPAVIPPALLAGIPETARIEFRWSFTRGES